jgi:hypothetical protein
VTHSPTAGVSYSVRRMLSKSCDTAIVMQIIICHSHGWQKSALLVTDQPRPRHTAHVVVSTGPRELTEILPPTRNNMTQPGRSWPRRREAFLPLARSYRIKGMPKASLYCRGRRERHSRGDRDGVAARKGQRAKLTLVSRAMRCHPKE